MSDFQTTIQYLKTKKRPLLLTTSNRWNEQGGEKPKSTLLAYKIASLVPGTRVIEVPLLNIYPCEGNVSTKDGNTCGVKKAKLGNAEKNPTGHHRCWASINNPDDELWKISKELLTSDAVIFFGSVRWGQMNSIYQTLIERLTWLENRHSTLGEDNILSAIDAGIVAVGHNWRGKEIVETQKEVLGFFGFSVKDELCWNWQFMNDPENESDSLYRKAHTKFEQEFLN